MLARIIEKIPLFRVFIITSSEHRRGAAHELTYILLFTAIPILASCAAIYISIVSATPIDEISSAVFARLFKGELFIAAASLIGTVFFVIAKNFKVPAVMLDKTWLIAISILGFAACIVFFVFEKLEALLNPQNVVRLSLLVYGASLVITFVALSYKNHFDHLQPPTPQDFQKSKRSVMDDLNENPQ